MKERVCKKCGKVFIPKSTRQQCCNKTIQNSCIVCGKTIESICTTTPQKLTCSSKCQAVYSNTIKIQSASLTVKKCKWCGKEFTPTSARDAYCKEIHYQVCYVCGNQFEMDVRKDQSVKTCSAECRYTLMLSSTDREASVARYKEVLLEKYGVDNPSKIENSQRKAQETCMMKYGKSYYSQTNEYREKVKQTSLSKYRVSHHLQCPEVRDKIAQTNLEKHKWENIFRAADGQAYAKSKFLAKYGHSNPSQVAEFKSKATKSARTSKLETRIVNIFNNYNIDFVHHYILSNENLSHEFDFYIPKYNLLIDADGLYFHSYLDDPDGKCVRDDYDEIRLKLIPDDTIFHVIVEGEEDEQIHDLINVLESVGGSLSQYDSYLFEWCRSIDFPYPSYDDQRLMREWNHLISYTSETYKPTCRIGESIIKQFHKSLYQCHVGNCISPYEGWFNDNKLKQVIRNRVIYKNMVDPSKILAGFNVSKIAPCVSIFNPVLAKYLITNYLSEYNTVFDPFSGFSGRLLGCAACGKNYVGQDINESAVKESNDIINHLNLNSSCSVTRKDLFESEGKYECLLTCPPYFKKEIYNAETVFKPCEEWIDECLSRFKCDKYVFVVDDAGRHSDHIVMELVNSSHFSKNKEYVVVIDSSSAER